MHQLPPLFLAHIRRRLESSQEHFLFAKTEKVFQVVFDTLGERHFAEK
jgi:hypothetical protein